MPQGVTPKKGKKNHKHGRNKVKCAAYRARSRNRKLAKLRKHLNNHPDDGCAIRALRVAQVA